MSRRLHFPGRQVAGHPPVITIDSSSSSDSSSEEEWDDEENSFISIDDNSSDDLDSKGSDDLVENLTNKLKGVTLQSEIPRKAVAKLPSDDLYSSSDDDSLAELLARPIFSSSARKVASKANLKVDTDSDDSSAEGLPVKKPAATPSTALNKSPKNAVETNLVDDTAAWCLDPNKNEYFLCSSRKPEGVAMWPNIKVPASLFKKLYSHQHSGVQWMATLHHKKIGGILGDDMGMGKTYQTLTYIGGLMKAKTIRNALVVAPVSLLRSWESEACTVLKGNCVPNATIMVLSSDVAKTRRRTLVSNALKSSSKGRPHFIITTYGLVGSEPRAFLDGNLFWDYVILDEGHTIKNTNTKVSQNCRVICQNPETRRLLLTGTPIMNNLNELWALFDFATSGRVLGPSRQFVQNFARPIEDARDKSASSATMRIAEKANKLLQELLQPYFVQRLKIDFLKDKLPKKTEVVVWTHLSKSQRSKYEEYVKHGESVKNVLYGDAKSPLEAVTWLKKLCGHPLLVDQRVPQDIAGYVEKTPQMELVVRSAKLKFLTSLVAKLVRDGHRILIFSQSTRMLDIIERVLGDVALLRIDGKTKEKDRQRNVDAFNRSNSNVKAMLLSTKAAGLGLTLTGADRAVIYDPSWNPAEDSQAIDRCYRIGQKREVVVYRLIAAGTVEEKMYEKQVHKDGLRRAVMTSTGNATERHFDKHDLRKLFTLAPEGECELLKKLQDGGNDINLEKLEGGPGISSLKGVIGLSRHDGFYTKSVVCIDNEAVTPDGTPFNGGTDGSGKGRSQRVLQNVKTAKFPALDTSGVDPNKENANHPNHPSHLAVNPTSSECYPKKAAGVSRSELSSAADVRPLEKKENIRSIESIFRRAEALSSAHQYDGALGLLLDTLETRMSDLDRGEKLRLHNAIAKTGNALSFL